MNQPLTVKCDFKTRRGPRGKKETVTPSADADAKTPVKIPRIARLMALAIKFDGLVRSGQVRDYAELARLAGVSRARITQIMNLLNLAPGIQEELLFLAKDEIGTRVRLHNLQLVAAKLNWNGQSWVV